MPDIRQHHYQFAYGLLPAWLFRSDFARLLLATYPESMAGVQKMWTQFGKRFPGAHRVRRGKITWIGHRIGSDSVVLILQMPRAKRPLETHFLALAYLPELRYFTVGNSIDLSRLKTFREVTPTLNANCGYISDPTADSVLAYLRERLELTGTAESLSKDDAQLFAQRVPCFEPLPAVGQNNGTA